MVKLSRKHRNAVGNAKVDGPFSCNRSQVISQRAVIQNYETAYEGLLSYHDFSVGLIGKQPSVSIPPPVKVQLNEHNIIDAERAILNAYRNDANSLHAKLKRSPVWSLMYDGISKFSTEYNEVF